MKAAVLGSPIAHSLSPVMHRAAYAALGLDWTYEALEVTADRLPGFLSELDGTWAGLSLTMPLKEAVIPLVDALAEDARLVASVNTLIPVFAHDVERSVGWRGENTDIEGIVAALREAGVETAPTATILGSGATARSALAALARLGVSGIDICARRVDAAQRLVDIARQLGVAACVHGFEPDPGLLAARVVVATVPPGASDTWASAAGDTAGSTLLDVAYAQPSELGRVWRGASASGLSMLLWQAVEQVRLMTGHAAPVDVMREALERAQEART